VAKELTSLVDRKLSETKSGAGAERRSLRKR